MNYDENLRKVITAAYLHSRGETQTKIAQRLGISASTVSRFVERGRDYMEISWKVPNEVEIAAEIVHQYGIRDAYVVESGDAGIGNQSQVIGAAAAKYFMARVGSGEDVGVSCGSTLLEMVNALPKRPSMGLGFAQCTIESDPYTLDEAPATLIGILKSKLGPERDSLGLQLPPVTGVREERDYRRWLRQSDTLTQMRERAFGCKHYFLGIGRVEFEQQEENAFSKMANLASNETFPDSVAALNLVGEINNQVFDLKGIDRTLEVSGLKDYCINLVELDALRKKAEHPRVTVAGVAGGKNKVEAIRAAIKAKLINVLITDVRTAVDLCQM